MDVLSIFITGLFTGGLTCLAVQGGLLATTIAQREREVEGHINRFGHALPVIQFLLARLVAYTVLGIALGALGSVMQLSVMMRAILQLAVSLFMIATALNLLQVHPVFRYTVIQPPKFLMRMVRSRSRDGGAFAPVLLGSMTVLIPCGATQAMMAYAVTTGSPVGGAVTMAVFIIGTSPLFFLLGYLARRFGRAFGPVFNRAAAIAIILIALYSLDGAIALTGSPWTVSNAVTTVRSINTRYRERITGTAVAINAVPVSTATILFTPTGYRTEPGTIAVKAGSEVTLSLVNRDGGGCIQAFTIPSLNIQRIVRVGAVETLTFRVPEKAGPLPFMCSMGMYRGQMEVI